ncbi:glycosyltransferase [Cohnella cholangitidis]|uniref:Glycosyltransferase n=1 Tax=Cohnella cholangitidis TaxID=2598458 RepID=A0A7G5BXI4_9BACL|nr:glycosyltransferase [Cohnella cholangitidis]QMV41668.1 glycosyltransferase [Cohnella cholangitidis]
MEKELVRKIVHINTNDSLGGAAKVAQSLMFRQNSDSIRASMLVGFKQSSYPYSFPFDIRRNELEATNLQQQGLLDYEFEGSYELIHNQLVEEADVLHLHNLHSYYFHPLSLRKLASSKPTVWTLHDMHALTGHCAHSFLCEKWKSGCDGCPDLNTYPKIQVDSAHLLWKEKKRMYEQTPLQIVVPSQWLKAKVESSILSQYKTHLIYNGIDTEFFNPELTKSLRKEIRDRYGIGEQAIVIGLSAHGGLSNPYKGGAYAERVIQYCEEKYDEFYFLNIGATGESKRGKMINTGYISSAQELRDLYSILDLFLYTSVADNCPLVILEAMSMGIPIVSFGTGGIPELVRDGVDGYIAATHDVSQMIDLVSSLIEDRERQVLFSRNSRNRASDLFSLRKMAEAYEKVYDDATLEFPFTPLKIAKPSRSSASLTETTKKRRLLIYYSQVDSCDRIGNPLMKLPLNFEDRFAVEFLTENQMMNVKIEDTDLIWPISPEVQINPDLLPSILYNLSNQDFIWTNLGLKRNNGAGFHRSFHIDTVVERNLVRVSTEHLGSIVFQGQFFNRNKDRIAKGQSIQTAIDKQSRYNVELASRSLVSYAEWLLRGHSQRLTYIYGAGGHTQELLDELEGRIEFKGIIDQDRKLKGKTVRGIPIYHIGDLTHLEIDSILISSASFEDEIYANLKKICTTEVLRLYRPY